MPEMDVNNSKVDAAHDLPGLPAALEQVREEVVEVLRRHELIGHRPLRRAGVGFACIEVCLYTDLHFLEVQFY